MLNGTQANRIAYSAIALVVALGTISCTVRTEILPPFQDGIVDMKMFDTSTPVALDGVWEFFWNRFIDPVSFLDGGQPLPDALAAFPAVWSDYGLDGVGPTGYATWRLRLTGLTPGRAYGLKASSFSSAVAIHVNGELVQSHGWPGRSETDEAAGWDSRVSQISADQTGIVDIVMHVSSWSAGKGGSRSSVIFGDFDKIMAQHGQAVAYDVLVVGAMAALGAVYLGLFAVRRASIAAFWFGLLSMVLAFLTICQGEYFIMSIFPGIEWRLLFVARHLSMALALLLFMAIPRTAFPREFPSAIVPVIALVSIAWVSVVIWAPASLTTRVFPWYQAFSLLTALVVIIATIVAIVRRRPGAWLFGIVTISSLVVFAHDTLLYNGFIGGDMLAQSSMLILLFGFSIALARGVVNVSGASVIEPAGLARPEVPGEQRVAERLVPSEVLPFFKRERIGDLALGDTASRLMAIMSVTLLDSSRMPELSTPAAVFAFINEFLDRVAPAFAAADGFVYRYEGYGFSVLFHNGAEAALRCAMDMQSRIAAYNTERENRGRKIVGIAMGLHSGELVLGTVGDSRRLDISVVSADFELGSRLMNLAVDYDLRIAASERFLSDLKEPSSCRIRMVGKTRGAGKTKPVPVFEIYDDDPEEVASRKDATRALFERAVDAWHARRLDQARALFSEVLAKVPGDGASLKYMASMKSRMPDQASAKPGI